MKQIIKFQLFFFLIISLVLPLACMKLNNTEENNICSGKTLDWLRQHVPIPPSTIESQKPLAGGLCEIILKTGPQYIPVYVNDEMVLAGEMFKDKIQVTENTINQLKAKTIQHNRETLDKATAFTYAPAGAGEDSPTVYMITDPLCPYCSRAAQNIQGLMDKHRAVLKTILYTVHGETGEEKNKDAICQGMDLSTYVATDWKSESTEPKACDRYTELHKNTKEMINTIGIQGVPVFILEDGRMVKGANLQKLEDYLTHPMKVAKR
ncbi:MAG: thioredoxin fold domain-containing protein [Proteobacteria bacterium]|nr:thioredoxin fold domain-containing protein [Pseudomonadota bacterium]